MITKQLIESIREKAQEKIAKLNREASVLGIAVHELDLAYRSGVLPHHQNANRQQLVEAAALVKRLTEGVQ